MQPFRKPASIAAPLGLLLASCLHREPAPPTLVAPIAPPGFSPVVRYLGSDRDFFQAHAADVLRGVHAAAAPGPVQLLALSGGGAGGAFGAGALLGLTRRGERPEFHIVTGVSTGALLAPFAFLGPAWNEEMMEAFGADRLQHLLRPRLVSFVVRPGYYKGRPLRELVDGFVTDRLVAAVAAEAAQGRRLLVATTDLDKQEPVIWDLGAIAARGEEEARTLFRDVLVASASIPGLFPPVLIRVTDGDRSFDEMHVDGSTTLPVFVTGEIGHLTPGAFAGLEGARIWMIVNGQLMASPDATRYRPIPVLTRAVSSALMHSTRRSVEITADFAERHGMSFQFSHIPVTYPYEGTLDFAPASLQALFDYGARCAETGQLWTTLPRAIDEGQRAATKPPTSSDDCPAPAGP